MSQEAIRYAESTRRALIGSLATGLLKTPKAPRAVRSDSLGKVEV